MRFNIKLGEIRAGPNFAVKFGETNQTFRAGFTAFQAVTGTNPEYTGPTTVTCDWDAATGDATAAAAEILTGKTAYVKSKKVTGTMPNRGAVTGKATAQTVLPDEDYNCLAQVEVAAIPYAVSDNTSGGKTVTIG